MRRKVLTVRRFPCPGVSRKGGRLLHCARNDSVGASRIVIAKAAQNDRSNLVIVERVRIEPDGIHRCNLFSCVEVTRYA
jgi:hypothetical protein